MPKRALLEAAFTHLDPDERAALAASFYADLVRRSRLRQFGLKTIVRKYKLKPLERAALLLQTAYLKRRHAAMQARPVEQVLPAFFDPAIGLMSDRGRRARQ
eukprot:5688156-Prymnesium_polylepis.1